MFKEDLSNFSPALPGSAVAATSRRELAAVAGDLKAASERAAAAAPAPAPATCAAAASQGPALFHCSAPLQRLLCDRGCS